MIECNDDTLHAAPGGWVVVPARQLSREDDVRAHVAHMHAARSAMVCSRQESSYSAAAAEVLHSAHTVVCSSTQLTGWCICRHAGMDAGMHETLVHTQICL